MSAIHPTALVDPSAELGDGVTVGPFAIVGPRCVVGDGCTIGPRATLQERVRLAPRVTVGEGTILGGDPQDVKYRGDETWVEVGEGTVIREHSTISRGTAASGRTVVGAGCYLMTYVHLGHDCRLGNGVTIANATQMSGHVTVQDHANISGLVAIHQFVTIGAYAFIGGLTRVSQDVPPYVRAVGSPMQLYGLNVIGLQRAGFPRETIMALKKAYRIVLNSDLTLSRAVERARHEVESIAEVETFLEFIASASRGVPA